MTKRDLYFAKLHKDAIIPTKRDEDAGYDFYPAFDERYISINPLETVLVPTGIATAIHNSKYLKLCERSSLASKGIKISGGIIDSGYRGNIMVCMYNTSINRTVIIAKDTKDFNVDKYQYVIDYRTAICQGIICDVIDMDTKIISYDDLSKIESIRNTQGFGSTD